MFLQFSSHRDLRSERYSRTTAITNQTMMNTTKNIKEKGICLVMLKLVAMFCKHLITLTYLNLCGLHSCAAKCNARCALRLNT